MTVLMREELNDADLAWAAAEPSVASTMAQMLRARQAFGAEPAGAETPRREGRAVEPGLLRARGAL